ncbi:hypothetical protein [Actinomyces minihominis]|uniref:hypothetical protein n=1 Tax=Actinomyces minihominis TaxID=2002838 RepID=UPI000C06A34E|nr:hypothetical protein [Actinomyces minihominis]
MGSQQTSQTSGAQRPRKKKPRRAVYVTRVDNGGEEPEVVVGDDTLSPLGSDMEASRDASPETTPPSESGDDRWLRENVPPHW